MNDNNIFPQRYSGFSIAAICLQCTWIVILAAFVTAPAAARSINDALGTTGFGSLKAIADAEISSTGECHAARDGAAGLFVHPAAIAGLETSMAKLSFVNHYVDTQYGTVGYARNIEGRYLGLRMNYVNYGEFVGTDESGVRTGAFTAADMGFTLNAGKIFADGLKGGVMVSFLTSRIEDYSAQAVTVDLGGIYETPFEGLSVGAVAKNLGTVTKSYSGEHTETLPTMLTVGFIKKLAHAPLTFMSDVTFPNDNDIVYSFGGELAIQETFFIHLGTRSRSEVDLNSFKAETNYSGIVTYGVGFVFNRYRFNYAYLRDNMMENTHRVTLGIGLP